VIIGNPPFWVETEFALDLAVTYVDRLFKLCEWGYPPLQIWSAIGLKRLSDD
jgi:hypothetical protein